MCAIWRGRDPGVVIFFGASACGCWGSLGSAVRCLGLLGWGWGVDWTLSVSCTASFARIWGKFLGGVLHDWGAYGAGHVCRCDGAGRS